VTLTRDGTMQFQKQPDHELARGLVGKSTDTA
jgi:hypothetical protein